MTLDGDEDSIDYGEKGRKVITDEYLLLNTVRWILVIITSGNNHNASEYFI